jgi:hypothetical protein
MDFILKNKKTVIAFALLLVAFYVYSIFSDPEVAGTDQMAEGAATLVEIADELSGIQFNQEIFSEPAYRQLVDFTATLPSESPGRPNPFEVIGRD